MTNQVFCLLSSQIWTEAQRDKICETEEQKNYMKVGYGFAKIIAPNGMEIGSPLAHDEEGITYADIDLEQIIPGKFLIDPAGHYSTPGFLSLSFDRTEHKPIKHIGGATQKVLTYDELQFKSEAGI
ncbi:Nitrilase [compost metagenome]